MGSAERNLPYVLVMAGLVTAIHVFGANASNKAWMLAT
jgi:hypothetical protein